MALYDELFTELRYFSNVAYCYSDCPGTFRMSDQLTIDAKRLGQRAEEHGHHAVSIGRFWEALECFCVTQKGAVNVC